MRTLVVIALLSLMLWNCSGTSSAVIPNHNPASISKDSVRIANDELEYEIIIFDPGFVSWLNSAARPRGYYDQYFLESRNRLWVLEYNLRVNEPFRYSPNLYVMNIDYQRGVDYGYEVNYLLYNYLVYFQLTHKQNLGNFAARP